MDLVGMHAAELRQQMKLTVLTRSTPWTMIEINSLLLPPSFTNASHRGHPGVLILIGEYSRNAIEAVIPDHSFELQVVQGYDNPSLPFKPSLV